MNIKSIELLFYPCIILVNKRSGTCNDTNIPCTKLCIPDVVKDMNIKFFSQASRINETRHIS